MRLTRHNSTEANAFTVDDAGLWVGAVRRTGFFVEHDSAGHLKTGRPVYCCVELAARGPGVYFYVVRRK